MRVLDEIPVPLPHKAFDTGKAAKTAAQDSPR